MTNAPSPETISADPIRTHVEMIHDLARGVDGVLVVSAFNANLRNDRGTITHHKPGDVDGMIAAIEAHSGTPGANVYLGLQVMRRGLQRGQRGTEADIVAVLGLVADMDSDTGNAAGEYPIQPNYVLETSPGNLQPFWLFDRPVKPAEAKAIARGLKLATGSDHGTADITHVWRIPGTKNWPNKTKLDRGRSADPASVVVSAPWDGSLTDPFALLSVVGNNNVASAAQPIALGDLPDVDGITVSPRAAALLVADDVDNRSKHANRVAEQLAFDGHSAEEAAALFLSAKGNWIDRYPTEAAARKDFERLWSKEPCARHAVTVTTGAKLAAGLKPANDNVPKADPKPRFAITWFDDIEADKPKAWVVKNVLGEGEHTTISGLPGTGKSVVATDMACHIASGMDWFGRRVTQGLVLFVAAERKALTERRMMAFRKRHGVKDVPLLVLGGRIDMTSSLVDAKALADVIKQAEKDCGYSCVLIVIDTLTRVFGAGDQNTSKDMGRFIQACDELVRLTGAHVTVLHHTAWSGERGKGAIDLDGAVDASFLVSKNAGTYTLKCDGANDGDEGAIATFTMQSVELAKDEDGEPTTAPVVLPGESVATKLAKGHETKNVLDALQHSIAEEGVEPEGASFPDNILVVKEKQWRQAYYETQPSIAQETLKKRFLRAKKSLIEKGVVGSVGPWVWPTA